MSVLQLKGKVIARQRSRVRGQLLEALDGADDELRVDLGAVTGIDAQGLALLFAAGHAAAERGVSLRLDGLAAPQRELLQALGIGAVATLGGTGEGA